MNVEFIQHLSTSQHNNILSSVGMNLVANKLFSSSGTVLLPGEKRLE